MELELKRGNVGEVVEKVTLEAGDYTKLYLPAAEGCEDQASFVEIVGLDGDRFAYRLNTYTFDSDWEIDEKKELEEILGGYLEHELEEIDAIYKQYLAECETARREKITRVVQTALHL